MSSICYWIWSKDFFVIWESSKKMLNKCSDNRTIVSSNNFWGTWLEILYVLNNFSIKYEPPRPPRLSRREIRFSLLELEGKKSRLLLEKIGARRWPWAVNLSTKACLVTLGVVGTCTYVWCSSRDLYSIISLFCCSPKLMH